MKKTLAVLMAALLVAVCFATVGSAATTATLDTDYNVTTSSDLSMLFDGKTYVERNDPEAEDAWQNNGTAYAQGGMALFQNTKCTEKDVAASLVLTIDLGETKNIDNVVVYFYKEYIAMIGLGVSNTMTISASTDGDDYTKVGDFDFDSEPAVVDGATNGILGVFPETFEFEEPVTARYLELALPYEESSDTFYVKPGDPESGAKSIWEFVGITEIEINEATEGGDTSEPAGDTSSDADTSSEAPTTSSEAPTTSSEAPATSSVAESSTPSTGDAGMIAIVVLAAAAVIGAAVIVKKRA